MQRRDSADRWRLPPAERGRLTWFADPGLRVRYSVIAAVCSIRSDRLKRDGRERSSLREVVEREAKPRTRSSRAYGPGLGWTIAGSGGKQAGSGGFIAPMKTSNCPLDV
jgi:hypothetical protein